MRSAKSLFSLVQPCFHSLIIEAAPFHVFRLDCAAIGNAFNQPDLDLGVGEQRLRLSHLRLGWWDLLGTWCLFELPEAHLRRGESRFPHAEISGQFAVVQREERLPLAHVVARFDLQRGYHARSGTAQLDVFGFWFY